MINDFRCGIHFGDSDNDEEDEGEKLVFDNFDPEKNSILMMPWTVKVICITC